ncbi:hypothetical protein O181_101130 [Austropuccinia psidii MF-1]|uniref:Uncharacterized protein n=1 Tax=Austropuccinia psidii MF-1 TaxID=1389203 RepID=A0A9Q3JGY6_9BASI|nr:hypothetical protein [Austropuccinia psidii MF-1]
MPSTRSGTSYNPSSSSQKGHRSDYGRSQSVTEGQRPVDDLQINKICHSEADNTASLQTELTPQQEALVDIYKSSQKAYNIALLYKEYQILVDLWENCMNSFLTVRQLLGYPNT